MSRSFCTIGLALLAACASSGGTSTGENAATYVSGVELRATGAASLEAALYEARPRWLGLGRGSAEITRSGTVVACRGNLFVYIDGRRAQTPLKQIALTGIEGVRFLRSAPMRPDGDRNCPQIPAVDVLMATSRPTR